MMVGWRGQCLGAGIVSGVGVIDREAVLHILAVFEGTAAFSQSVFAQCCFRPIPALLASSAQHPA